MAATCGLLDDDVGNTIYLLEAFEPAPAENEPLVGRLYDNVLYGKSISTLQSSRPALTTFCYRSGTGV